MRLGPGTACTGAKFVMSCAMCEVSDSISASVRLLSHTRSLQSNNNFGFIVQRGDPMITITVHSVSGKHTHDAVVCTEDVRFALERPRIELI